MKGGIGTVVKLQELGAEEAHETMPVGRIENVDGAEIGDKVDCGRDSRLRSRAGGQLDRD